MNVERATCFWFFREFCGKGVEKEEKIEEAIPKKG